VSLCVELLNALPGFRAVVSARPIRGYNPSSKVARFHSLNVCFHGMVSPGMRVQIQGLIDDVKCFATVRAWRWPPGVTGPHCGAAPITKQGHDTIPPARQRDQCQSCQEPFDDLTGTIFAGHHPPLRVWLRCLDFMGLNLSNEQSAQELDLDPDEAPKMASPLREGRVQRKPAETLSGEVECDEVSVVAGQKGHPEAVKKTGGPADGDG
jgi:transposase-like protein